MNSDKQVPKKYRVNTLPFLAGLILGSAFIFFLALCLLFGTYGYFQITGRILPGISVAGTKLSHLTATEAAILLQRQWNLEREILVTDGIHQQTVSPSDLGLSVNPIRSANHAYEIGHSGQIFKDLAALFSVYQNNLQTPLEVELDLTAARSGLEALSVEMSLPPSDATIKVQETELITVPGTFGYTINIDDTLELMDADPTAVLTKSTLQVKLKPILPRITDLSPALEEGKKLIDTPVEIHAYDPIKDETVTWTVPRETVATWLIVVTTELGPDFRFDDSMVASYLEGKNRELGSDRWINPSIYSQQIVEKIEAGENLNININHKATTYMVQPGDTLLKIGWNQGIPFWMILDSNPGLDPDALVTGQTLTIPSKDDLLPYPIVEGKRVEISISKQRLWVYENGELISKHVISTGMDRSPTQPGVFQVQTHELNAYASVWDLTMPHFLGIYEAWPGFMNGIHGLPTLTGGRRLWANVLGSPASYGCIIMELDAAEWLYRWAEQGVIVEIQP